MSCDVRILDYNYVAQPQTEVIVSSIDSAFPGSNLKKTLRSKVTRTTSIIGEQSILFDLKTQEEINSVVVMPHPIDGFKFSSAVVLKVQANATNEWSSPAFEQVLTIDEPTQIASYFSVTDISFRYWRISITDPFNAYGYFEIGKVILGKKVSFERLPSIGFTLLTEDQSKSFSTPYGHKYFDVYPNIKTLTIDLNLMDEQDVYKWIDSFERVGRVTPVLLSLDSQDDIFEHNRFIIYGTYESNLTHKHIVRNRFDMPLVIGEIL